jgi:hypothetical protein
MVGKKKQVRRPRQTPRKILIPMIEVAERLDEPLLVAALRALLMKWTGRKQR